ncbi:MAG TPA: RNA polymerase sigma factor [Candidatus Dormibacteraeota bacterium]|nr:RNA polymerase sigma factor [Candidatus Dormibacteraeota bacterium]
MSDGGVQSEAGGPQRAPVRGADFIVLPARASDSWRTWLLTGVRRPPFDRRRIRGDHRGLKKMLIEGTAGADVRPQPWNDFSSAMVRQAVDEAMNTLPPGHKQAVKLAYFGGLTNQQVALHLGIAEGAVRRQLREALGAISAAIERGLVAGRRTIYAVAAWLAARQLYDLLRRAALPATDHVAQAAIVVAAGVVTASVLAGQSPSPAQITQVDRGRGTVTAAAPAQTAPLPSISGGTVTLKAPVASPPAVAPAVSLPVKVSPPVKLPVPLPTPSPALPKLPAI